MTDRADSSPLRAAFTDQLRRKNRHRRDHQQRLAQASATRPRRNDILPRLELSDIRIADLRPSPRKVRKLEPAHVREVASSISALGFCVPLLVARDNEIIHGEVRCEAAKQLGLDRLPCVRIGHLSPEEQRVLRLAVNRLAEKGEWDLDALKIEFDELTRGDHREFAMASGEMADAEFLVFNGAWIANVLPYLCEGGILGTFIDWRGLPTVHSAVRSLGLTPLNLIVWAKTNAGMGSLYRSQHELLPLFTRGSRPHVDNVELGKRGRWRSNVWTYPGASSLGSDARRGVKDHPTVKPTAMLEDALLDLTNRGDLVIDPFLGSGSTLIAAEATGRLCRGVELDPLYVDVIVRRYEAATGNVATLIETGVTFEALGARRASEGAPV